MVDDKVEPGEEASKVADSDVEDVEIPEEISEKLEKKMEEQRKERQYELEVTGMRAEAEDEPDIGFRNKRLEVVRGVVNQVEISIENIGENDFPGGQITETEIVTGVSGGATYPNATPEIPEIPVGKTRETEMELEIFTDGLCGLQAKIQSEDQGTVILGGSGDEEFSKAMVAIPRENLKMISELEEIKRLLQESE